MTSSLEGSIRRVSHLCEQIQYLFFLVVYLKTPGSQGSLFLAPGNEVICLVAEFCDGYMRLLVARGNSLKLRTRLVNDLS